MCAYKVGLKLCPPANNSEQKESERKITAGKHLQHDSAAASSFS